jgi:hypothetical protein
MKVPVLRPELNPVTENNQIPKTKPCPYCGESIAKVFADGVKDRGECADGGVAVAAQHAVQGLFIETGLHGLCQFRGLASDRQKGGGGLFRDL